MTPPHFAGPGSPDFETAPIIMVRAYRKTGSRHG